MSFVYIIFKFLPYTLNVGFSILLNRLVTFFHHRCRLTNLSSHDSDSIIYIELGHRSCLFRLQAFEDISTQAIRAKR